MGKAHIEIRGEPLCAVSTPAFRAVALACHYDSLREAILAMGDMWTLAAERPLEYEGRPMTHDDVAVVSGRCPRTAPVTP